MDVGLKTRVNLLIQLALIDGKLDVRELAFIYNVCIRNGVDLDTIGDMIEQSEPITNLSSLAPLERVTYITDCLMLTLIDSKVLPKETDFVMNIGAQLGFESALLEKLINTIESNKGISYHELHEKVLELTGIPKAT